MQSPDIPYKLNQGTKPKKQETFCTLKPKLEEKLKAIIGKLCL
jgi:hypothetical protein